MQQGRVGKSVSRFRFRVEQTSPGYTTKRDEPAPDQEAFGGHA